MQTYIQRNRAKKRKNIYSIFSSSCIYLYIFIIKLLSSLRFCQLYTFSRLLCKQLQLKTVNEEEDDEREKDGKIQQTECISWQTILEYLNDHVSERSKKARCKHSRNTSEANSPSKWGELSTACFPPTESSFIFTIVPSCIIIITIIEQLQSITKSRP